MKIALFTNVRARTNSNTPAQYAPGVVLFLFLKKVDHWKNIPFYDWKKLMFEWQFTWAAFDQNHSPESDRNFQLSYTCCFLWATPKSFENWLNSMLLISNHFTVFWTSRKKSDWKRLETLGRFEPNLHNSVKVFQLKIGRSLFRAVPCIGCTVRLFILECIEILFLLKDNLASFLSSFIGNQWLVSGKSKHEMRLFRTQWCILC